MQPEGRRIHTFHGRLRQPVSISAEPQEGGRTPCHSFHCSDPVCCQARVPAGLAEGSGKCWPVVWAVSIARADKMALDALRLHLLWAWKQNVLLSLLSSSSPLLPLLFLLLVCFFFFLKLLVQVPISVEHLSSSWHRHLGVPWGSR